MRTISAVLLATLVAGCGGSTQPVNFVGPAAAPSALECARGQLQNLGYVVETAAPAAGSASVTGVRINTAPWLLKLIGFQDTANQITATYAGGQLQVTAISSDPADPSEGGASVTGVGANRQTEQDAREVFTACDRD